MTADLGARGIRALRWNYLGNGLRVLSQFVAGVVLARLLGPEEFGTVAMAGLLVGIAALVADLGFGVVLVQRRVLTDEDIRFVSTVQVATGALLTLAGVASADWVAGWFHRPEAAPIFRAMASMFLLQAFGLTPLALLRRSLDFRGAQLVGVTSYLCGYVLVGIPLALLGAGAWSLAWAQLVQSALSSLLALRRRGHPARPLWRPPSPGLFAFGAKVIGANLTNWGLANADSVVIGRLLGAADLGTYGRAMAVVLSPLNALTASLQGVLFATSARAQADVDRLRQAYLGATTAVAALCFPLFVTVAVVPDAVIGALYGPAWSAAAPILVPLALAMPLTGVMSMAGPVVTAVGRVGLELRVALWTLLMFGGALALTGRRSAEAVAWAVVAVQGARAALMMAAVRPLVAATWRQVLGALWWPMWWAAITAAFTAALDGRLTGLAPLPRLAADVAAAGACLLLCLRLLGRRWLAGAHGELLRAEGRLPALARRWIDP